ncbi:phage tail protein [Parerythrobacter lacustris]|uniref:Phage tail protein n=1 Tax=Parerythrobacter lacustris TaxID=2969984 RepID=A0ABT1XRN4_9SPHN|nr:phage tail protein [Parerythrobacter lacustris]MCR2834267.1 phage tail protein [Parerythrobacter lacustris]
MATLILGGLGTLIGGPLGGAIGALAGRQIDAAIIGSPVRDGARLKDLSITTSSYGTPIPRHFGAVRAAGTIIWATELAENRETGGGGKGQPKVTSYSYSSSFAVALASRPIEGIGRIWADGNLLRGATGDLKTGGSLRIYTGFGDQPVDPLLAEAIGPDCPAFRQCAYAVFEDLSLEDFGNRIPALSFEVLAGDQLLSPSDFAGAEVVGLTGEMVYAGLLGISYEGGGLGDFLGRLQLLYPSTFDIGSDGIEIAPVPDAASGALLLPGPAATGDPDDFGTVDGFALARSEAGTRMPSSIRYYDRGRDYQPSVQRASGRADREDAEALEFPATFDPATARELIDQAHRRSRSRRETIRWRIAELDVTVGPGCLVALPGYPGQWLIDAWEWRDAGIELELSRIEPQPRGGLPGEPGLPVPPPDGTSGPTLLKAFELPWDGVGLPSGRQLFAALASESPDRSSAALYADRGGQLHPLGASGREQSVFGTLASPLAPSQGLLLESRGSLAVELAADSMGFFSSDMDGIARGRNRLMVGAELLQFMTCERTEERRWRLSGLLRGRAGTDVAAIAGHLPGASVILVDGPLVALGTSMALDSESVGVAAIGRGDSEPVLAAVENFGLGTRPPCPAHGMARNQGEAGLQLRWTRRSRGAWQWDDSIDVPVNEDVLLFEVGIGPVESPVVRWETPDTSLEIDAAFVALHSGQPVWVRQFGRRQMSVALLLAEL